MPCEFRILHWFFDFLLDEGIPFKWLHFANMKLIQSNSRGSNNLLSSQLPSKLLTFPLANNSSWVPVSTHSPPLNTTLAARSTYKFDHACWSKHINLYIYIHIIFYLSFLPFWKRETSSQLCQIIKSICIYLIFAIFEAYQNDNLEIEMIKLNTMVKMKPCKKGKVLNFSTKCASRGSNFASPMLIHIGQLQSWYNQICILHGG